MEGISQKVRHHLIFVVVFTASVAAAQPLMLTDSLSTTFGDFVIVPGCRGVFINSTGALSSVSIDDPFNTSSFSVDWAPEDNGWVGPGEIRLLRISPDGSQLCAAIQVSIPDSLLNSDLSIPEPIVILVCNSDGEGAEIVGVTLDSSEELSFDFTQNTRLLYGAHFLGCTPDPESFIALQVGADSNSILPYDVIDLEDGLRLNSWGIINDFFYSNPWSDLIAAGTASLTAIADVSTFLILFEDTTLTSSVIEQWVEPDAGLAQIDETQIIRLSDGTFFENPGDPFLVLCRMSKDNYIFSRDGGETLERGIIYWLAFEVEESQELPELTGYLTSRSRALPSDNNAGIVFRAGRGLYYYEFQ